MTQKERILEVFEDKEMMTIKMIAEFTGYPQSSIRQVMSKGENEGVFRRVLPGCYTIKKKP